MVLLDEDFSLKGLITVSILLASVIIVVAILSWPILRRSGLALRKSEEANTRTERAYPQLVAAPARIALRRRPRSYFPFVDPRGVMALRPLRNDSGGVLLDVDALYQVQTELKRTLFAGEKRKEVFAEAQGSASGVPLRTTGSNDSEQDEKEDECERNLQRLSWLASCEALEFVAGRLEQECPGLVQMVPPGENIGSAEGNVCAASGRRKLVNLATGHWWPVPKKEDFVEGGTKSESESEHPLVIAALNVQEDLAILLPGRETILFDGNALAGRSGKERNNNHHESAADSPGKLQEDSDSPEFAKTYILAAAAVCFADQWEVQEKIGKSLAGIHAEVEKYPRIRSAMDAFFRSLRPGQEKIRYNFTFCERAQLHLPKAPSEKDCPVEGTGLPFRVTMRVERQGLIRLPESGAVLFTIRTYLQAVEDIPVDFRADLAEVIRDKQERRTPLGSAHKCEMEDRVLWTLHKGAW